MNGLVHLDRALLLGTFIFSGSYLPLSILIFLCQTVLDEAVSRADRGVIEGVLVLYLRELLIGQSTHE